MNGGAKWKQIQNGAKWKQIARLGKHHQSRKASRNCFAIALRFEASDAKCARSCSHMEVGSWRSQWSSKASKRSKAARRLDTARCPCNGVRASKLRTCCRACPKIDRENPALKDQWRAHGKPLSLEHGKVFTCLTAIVFSERCSEA
jgi:hypothetical protein